MRKVRGSSDNQSYDDRSIYLLQKNSCIEEERKSTTSTVIQFPLISDAIQMVWPLNWRGVHLEE